MWQPPETFNFSRASEWPRWLNRFKRYREASGLHEKKDEQQISSLIYCMGPQAEEVFTTLRLTAQQSTKFDEVLKAFDSHFIPKRNVIYERSMFNQRTQKEGETADEFITALHTLAENCDYGTLKDDLIRDRIVVGIRDTTLMEKLQLKTDLTLASATTMVRQSEQIKKQTPQLSSKMDVDRVFTKKDKKKEFFKQKLINNFGQKNKNVGDEKLNWKKCRRCDGDAHPFNQCPAAKATCHKCKKKGHYAKVCRSSTESTVRAAATEVSYAFIGTAKAEYYSDPKPKRKRWAVMVEINNCMIRFKVDTGAEVTCISGDTYRTFFENKQLRPSDKRIYNADQGRMNSIGFFREKIRYCNKSIMVSVYVIEGLGESLLDGDACEDLEIIKRVDVNETTFKDEDRLSFDPTKKFPKLFQGLGKVKIPYKIRLRQDATPYSLTVPRRVPIPLLDEIKGNLDNMVLLGVIEPVEEPTDWCSGLVLSPKPNGTIRMCVDYVQLNKYVLREVHPMPNTENVLGRLGKAKYFSKMDANHGFWQCELDPESQLLTTFITPFGRYKYKRLPFGINAAPEFFQKRMQQILQGLDGVLINIDDILVYGETMAEHDERLQRVFQRLIKAEVTLNVDKCTFGAKRVKFLGHIIDEQGIHVDDERVAAIREMGQPQNVSELRSLLGSVNYLGKFIPSLSTKAHALNEMLSGRNDFTWGHEQKKAFEQIKKDLVKAPVLAWFDPNKETVITADASSYGVGAVLKQRQEDGKFRPIAYASKTLTSHQKNWAQIEKEGYALVWACERFRDFITGIKVMLETDHKPLVPIFSKKELDELTPKLQRMRLRLARYWYDIRHIPGKELGAADILSRRPMKCAEDDDDLEMNVTAYVRMITNNLPTTDARLLEIYKAQLQDQVCRKLREYSKNGWPKQSEIGSDLKDFWQHRSEITIQEGLLMKAARIYIPSGPLRRDILLKIHEGHLGITKCRARARESVWWPKISNEIEELIKTCTQCVEETKNNREPLIPSEFPRRPWQKIGIDLFKLDQRWYLLVTDYFSRYPEITLLKSMQEVEVIKHLKSIFARHGTPEEVYSDNGTHFGPLLTSEFSQFAKEWAFRHTTSSPKFPQSNGFIESIVKVIKRSLKKCDDPYKALQSYRATPLSNGFSPAELLMGRRIRTTVPMATKKLDPKIPDKRVLRRKEEETRSNQKYNYDTRHRAKDLPELKAGDPVWIIDLQRYGKVKEKHNSPRSYIVDTGKRTVRRNRFHLVPTPNGTYDESFSIDFPEDTEEEVNEEPNIIVPSAIEQPQNPQCEQAGGGVRPDQRTITRSGRHINPPERLIESC